MAFKLEAAESKLQDLKSNVATLGKEAAAAMAAVESQQQRLTLQRLISMVMHLYFYILGLEKSQKLVFKMLFLTYYPYCFQGWIWTSIPSTSSSNTWSTGRRSKCNVSARYIFSEACAPILWYRITFLRCLMIMFCSDDVWAPTNRTCPCSCRSSEHGQYVCTSIVWRSK